MISAFTALLASALISPLAIAHPDLTKRQLPVGRVITSCIVPGVVAITFDDGPYQYTDRVLDLLKASGQKATFFVNGDNYAPIANYAPTIKRMIDEGHQIGSHTWKHANLTDPSVNIQEQMFLLENALVSILGYYPTYMRPPYLNTDARVLNTLGSLGYHVITIDIDTEDWKNTSPDLIKISITNYQNGVNNGGTISLSHDPLVDTVNTLVPAMLDFLNTKGLKSVPVGQCLSDNPANWYAGPRSTPPTSTSSSPPSPSVTLSPDGSCGGSKGYTCRPGYCCSKYGYCGVTNEYCADGCQKQWGICKS